LSLSHYHFRGKQHLLAEVRKRENDRLLEPQRALFAGPETLAEKWRTACAYLSEDLRSGYVRILWELWAVGLADEELAGHWRDAIAGWRNLLTGGAEEWKAELDFDLPISQRERAARDGDAYL